MRNHVQLADAYYRLSDEERKYGESASITNQRTIVREYCEKHGIILVEEFADDGYSGGNFERPGLPRHAGASENRQGQHGHYQRPGPGWAVI